jgi:hypothetical protein
MFSRLSRLLVGALSFAILPISASGQISVRGDAVQERIAGGGTSYEGTISISNAGAEPVDARIFQTDYSFQADGSTGFERAGSTPRSNAVWILLSSSQVVIPAGQTVDVHYRVSVPAAADSLRGSYWSLIMVEGLPRRSDTPASEPRRLTVETTTRYGVQVVTHIGSSGTPKVDFAAVANSAADGARSLNVDLTNVGDRAGRLQLTLEVYAPDGRQIATLRQTRGLVYPGTSIRQRFALGALPAGSYKALLVADAGGNAVFGAQYTLKF